MIKRHNCIFFILVIRAMDDLLKDYDRLCVLIDRYKNRKEHNKSVEQTEKKIDEIIIKIIINIKTNIKLYDRKTRNEIKLCIAEFETMRNRSKLIFDKDETSSQPKTNDEYLAKASMTTKNTTDELKSSLQKLEECRDIGNNAIITISIDNDRLARVRDRIDDIDSDLHIAHRLLTRFTKRLYTDKLIWCFVIIIIGLITIILLMNQDILSF